MDGPSALERIRSLPVVVPPLDLQPLSLQRIELEHERERADLALVQAACRAEPGKGAHVDVYA